MKLEQYFPISAYTKERDVQSLVIAILIYVAIGVVIGVVGAIIGWIPVVRILVGIVKWLIEVYCAAGIIVAALKYAGIKLDR